jgi:hypothetical protein
MPFSPRRMLATVLALAAGPCAHSPGNKEDYRNAVDRLCEKLRDNGMPCNGKPAMR